MRDRIYLRSSSGKPKSSLFRVMTTTEARANSRTDNHSNGNTDEGKTNGQSSAFSWLKPHARFVVILVGPEEEPFGLQLDFLCAKSTYYKNLFENEVEDVSLESLVKLPDFSIEIFGLAQNFMFTNSLYQSADADSIPTFDTLIAAWKLGNKLGIEGLCEATLAAMILRKNITNSIPTTPSLVQVWKDTPEGSSIRKLLLTWAAEYIRSSESRAEFSKSLPQEMLSELVIAMSELPSRSSRDESSSTLPAAPVSIRQKNVHYLDYEERGDQATNGGDIKPNATKLGRRSLPAVAPSHSTSGPSPVPYQRKPGRTSLPTSGPSSTTPLGGPRPSKKPRLQPYNNPDPMSYSSDRKLNFCNDLLCRMLSGPGFWTRLVGAFREPVDPERDNVPDYLEKITRPMDLTSIKNKMDHREYSSDKEFIEDVRQIFRNCYTYHPEDSPLRQTCIKFEKTFEDKLNTMGKWLAKSEDTETSFSPPI